jgi:hypothetical protein
MLLLRKMLMSQEKENKQENDLIPSLLLPPLSGSGKRKFVEYFAGWCAASNQSLVVRPYKPENLAYFRPPIRVIPRYPRIRFSLNTLNEVRMRLLDTLLLFCRDSSIDVNSCDDIMLLAICIVVAEFSEELSFWLDTRFDFVDNLLELCLHQVVSSFKLLNRLSGFVFDNSQLT